MRVLLTPVALEDIAAIYQAHSGDFAKRAEDAVFDALDSFATFPQFGVETDEVGVHRWPSSTTPSSIASVGKKRSLR
jgi:hypothetical protein